MRQVLAMTLSGIAIGLPIAWGSSRLVQSFLYGIQPNDPAAIGFAAAALMGAAALAGYAPALRASRVDPMTTLRHE